MNTQDLRTLKILEAIDCSDSPSQRDLAQSLNVSLGLVNSFVRRLAKKGYFKITHLPRNRIRYILTPKGAAEKSRLTYTYIQVSLQFYKDARHKFKKMLIDLACQGIKAVAFYGSGDMAEIGCISIRETGLNLVAISDPQCYGDTLFDVPIVAPQELANYQFERIIITSIDIPPQKAVAILESNGVPKDIVLAL